MKKFSDMRQRMFKFLLAATLSICVGYPPGTAPAQETQSPTGTFNRDYFWAVNQTNYWRGLATSDVVTHHINPAAKYIAQGDFARAKRELEFVLTRFVNHPQALVLAGMVSRGNKDYAWGIGNFERALTLYPDHALTHAQYGKFLVDLGQLNDGIQRLKHALEMDPKLAAAYEWLAGAYMKIGEAELARDTRERAQSLGLSGKTAER